jgi:GNAT superfamily N-acetyltransferase
MGAGLTIRPADEADGSDIADLLRQLGYPAAAETVPGRLARMLAEPGQTVLVAAEGKLVVGLATVIVRHVITDDSPFARLAALVVAEDRRGRGIGRALAAAAEDIALSAGCSAIEVTSGDHRPDAHAFYRGLGYEERPRRFLKRLPPGSRERSPRGFGRPSGR